MDSNHGTTAAGTTETAAGDRTPRGNAAALISVCLGFFVIQPDVTIVNVALPAIQRQVGGSLAGLQWVVDAYTPALASIMLTAGSAADRIGARKVFTAGLITFAAGSAACAAAPALGVLAAARAVQGLGASALVPCSLALLVHQFPDPQARARALGVWGAMGSLGVALAGLTAGFITAGQRGWLSPLPGAMLAAGLLAGWLFIRAERVQQAPMLPLRLFRSRAFSGATAVGVMFNLCLYGTLLCLSLFLQQQRHESALATGLLLVPSSLMVGAGSLASGRLTARYGPRRPMMAGLILGAAGAAVLAAVGTRTSLWLLVAGSVLIGLVALAMPAMTAVAVGTAGREHAGAASGILNAARQSGGALGVAVLGSLLGSGQGARVTS